VKDKIVQAPKKCGVKVFRRVATRHDKLDVTFLGFVHIAGTMKWRH
jgi:hypothetical protein